MPHTIASTAASLNRHAIQYAGNIQQKLRTGLEFENLLKPRACDNTYSAPNVSISEMIQQYQWQFTPKGNPTFDAVENKLQKIKVDILLTADDLEKYWDAWKVEWHEIGKNPLDWTLNRYLYDEVMMPKILEEMNQNSWSGVYAAPTAGTAGVSVNSVDGYNKVLTDAVAANLIVPIATGALVATTIVDQVETFCDAIPQPYRDLPGVLLMSKTNARNYARDYRAKFGTGNSVNNPNDELRVDATMKRIVGIAAMEGSDKIIFDPASITNMIWGTRRGYASYPTIRWDGGIREIKGTAEFYRFYGFEYFEHLFINEQA